MSNYAYFEGLLIGTARVPTTVAERVALQSRLAEVPEGLFGAVPQAPLNEMTASVMVDDEPMSSLELNGRGTTTTAAPTHTTTTGSKTASGPRPRETVDQAPELLFPYGEGPHRFGLQSCHSATVHRAAKFWVVCDLGDDADVAPAITELLNELSAELWRTYRDSSDECGGLHFTRKMLGLQVRDDLLGIVERGEIDWDDYVDGQSGVMFELRLGPPRLAVLATQLGALLRRCDPANRASVLTELRRELVALTEAEIGWGDGRAGQVNAHIFGGCNDNELEYASELIAGRDWARLRTGVAPVAACIAAAHWLGVSAQAAKQMTGREAWWLFEEAAVLFRVDQFIAPYAADMGARGWSPTQIVHTLLGHVSMSVRTIEEMAGLVQTTANFHGIVEAAGDWVLDWMDEATGIARAQAAFEQNHRHTDPEGQADPGDQDDLDDQDGDEKSELLDITDQPQEDTNEDTGDVSSSSGSDDGERCGVVTLPKAGMSEYEDRVTLDEELPELLGMFDEELVREVLAGFDAREVTAWTVPAAMHLMGIFTRHDDTETAALNDLGYGEVDDPRVFWRSEPLYTLLGEIAGRLLGPARPPAVLLEYLLAGIRTLEHIVPNYLMCYTNAIAGTEDDPDTGRSITSLDENDRELLEQYRTDYLQAVFDTESEHRFRLLKQ